MLQEVMLCLEQYKVKIYVNDCLYEFLSSRNSTKDIAGLITSENVGQVALDCMITLGGDGTILGAVTLIGPHQIPILGINLGRLGFLAAVEGQNLQYALDKLIKGHYRIEHRSMLFLESQPSLFQHSPFALNDFTLHKRDTSSMITIHTYINGDYLTSYWADGIIIATPTGSTGYSLSCGGPIVFPDAQSIIITPVAPHNLNVRPLVVDDNSILSFEIEGRSKHFLCTLDSRHEAITAKHQLAIKRNNFTTQIIVLNGYSYLNTIREKLSWGTDQRNQF